MSITFIGGGNMANALIGGLIRRGTSPHEIHVVEPLVAAREALVRQYGVSAAPALEESRLACEVLVLAVKPQQMLAALAPVRGKLNGQVVLSIAAGTRIDTLSQALGGYRRIVRAMPNTPALIGEGITGLCAEPSVTAPERARAEAVLAAAGATLWVADEARIDAITAISGSGPAYVFYFIEALETAARDIGFDPQAARTLALHTFKGAALLAAASAESPAALREKVTSKGGTTEAALQALRADAVAESLGRAVQAAFARGQALGREASDEDSKPC